jgi:hypothetical protein
MLFWRSLLGPIALWPLVGDPSWNLLGLQSHIQLLLIIINSTTNIKILKSAHKKIAVMIHAKPYFSVKKFKKKLVKKS